MKISLIIPRQMAKKGLTIWRGANYADLSPSGSGSTPESFVNRILEIILVVFLSAGVGALMFPNYVPQAVLFAFVIATVTGAVRIQKIRNALGERFGNTLQEVATNAWVWFGIVAISWLFILVLLFSHQFSPPMATSESAKVEWPMLRWPAFTKQEISDWAEALRSFPASVTMEINYSSEQDQDFVAGIVEVEREVKWSYAGAVLGA